MKSAILSKARIKALKPEDRRYLVADGASLYLEIHPTGRKSWRVRYRLNGKPAKINLGRYPKISPAQARKDRDKIIEAVRAGMSPAEARRREKLIALKGVTVREFGERYMREIVKDVRKNPDDVRRYLERDLYPELADKPLSSIKVDDLRQLVFARKDAGHKQAALALRDLLKRLWDYAVVRGVVDANPVLAIPRKYIARANPRCRALSAAEVGQYMNRVDGSRLRLGVRCALKLILLTLTRKSELLLARWDHIDLKKGEWIIPPEHTKNKKTHLVFLSAFAQKILHELAADCPPYGRPRPNQFVIPALWSRTQPMSESTLNRALDRISHGMAHFTVHDLRRTAATLLSEDEYHADVIEKALNHTIKGVRGVYNRAQYSEQRRTMLQNWADKIEDLAIEWRRTKDGDAYHHHGFVGPSRP